MWGVGFGAGLGVPVALQPLREGERPLVRARAHLVGGK